MAVSGIWNHVVWINGTRVSEYLPWNTLAYFLRKADKHLTDVFNIVGHPRIYQTTRNHMSENEIRSNNLRTLRATPDIYL
jgi:hypothetical protein